MGQKRARATFESLERRALLSAAAGGVEIHPYIDLIYDDAQQSIQTDFDTLGVSTKDGKLLVELFPTITHDISQLANQVVDIGGELVSSASSFVRAFVPFGELHDLRFMPLSVAEPVVTLLDRGIEFRIDPELRAIGELRPNDGYVDVDLAASDTEQMLVALRNLGATKLARAGNLVSAYLPVVAIEQLADAVPTLRFARVPTAVTSVGSVTSQGDSAIQADEARLAAPNGFGVDGAGVTVGVISNSYNQLGGEASDIATGDLPSGVDIRDDSMTATSAIDEGRAMLQIIHDVAPGAALAFHTGLGGQAAFAAAIDDLADPSGGNADIIIDDLMYLSEPMFQDGVIAQAVDNAVQGGVSYFSAAGNNGTAGYESAYRAGTNYASGSFGSGAFLGGRAHDFDPGAGVDNFQSLTLQPSETILLSFQWDEPNFSVSGGSGAQSEMDVYLLNAAGTALVAVATTTNVGGDAIELITYTNTGGSAATYNLMLVRRSGNSPGAMKYVDFGNTGDTAGDAFNEWTTESGTVYGHANADGAFAVAAANYSSTPEFGSTPPVIASYSSRGTTSILFDILGNRLGSAVVRDAPRATGPEGGNTT
ncbi:MAG TPA: hypothetical protein PKB10_04810, partial [Tepidisphaeraceae bacterium]|nr:hypothetical protein [Tepidisphaeraceae bacterium]